MRNSSSAYLDGTSRVVRAHAVVENNRPSFVRSTQAEIVPAGFTLLAYDAEKSGPYYQRVGLFAHTDGTVHLLTCLLTSPTATRTWVDKGSITITSVQPDYPYTISIFRGVVFIGCYDYQQKYTLSSAVFENLSFPRVTSANIITSMMGGCNSTCAYINKDETGYQSVDFRFGTAGNGGIFSANVHPVRFAQQINAKCVVTPFAATYNYKQYFFFDNPNKGTIQFFWGKPVQGVVGSADVGFGAITDILPLDTYDDENNLRLVGAGIIGSTIPVITARLKRKNGGHYLIYMIGPDTSDPFARDVFSTGRDMIIDEVNENDPIYGGLWCRTDGAHFIGWGYNYASGPSRIFQATPASQVVNVSRCEMSFPVNSTASIALEAEEEIPAGSEVSIVLECGASLSSMQTINLGRFGVDGSSSESTESGTRTSVNGTGMGGKSIAQWYSDSALTYLSQESEVGPASDLTKLIRKSGSWDKTSTPTAGLYNGEMNVDGILYSTVPASYGGIMKAEFIPVNPNSYPCRFGVGIDYVEETIAEYAARRSEKIEDLNTDWLQKSGVFFVLYRNPGANVVDPINSGFYYYDTAWVAPEMPYYGEAGIWTKVRSLQDFGVSITIPAGGIALMLAGSSGYYVARWKNIGSSYWNEVSCDIPTFMGGAALRPGYRAEKDMYGRGAVLMTSDTPWATSASTPSTASVIGYMQSGFGEYLPSAGTIEIDSEIISYTSRKNVATYASRYIYGPTIADNLFSDGSLLSVSSLVDKSNAYLRQRITLSANTYLKGIELWVKRIGFPDDGLNVSVYRDAGNPNFGTKIASNYISTMSVPEDGGFVSVSFGSGIEIMDGDTIVLSRSNSPSHPNTENYYQVRIKPGYATNCQFFNDATDTWVSQAGAVSFKVYRCVDEPGGRYAFCLADIVYWMEGATYSFNNTLDHYVDAALSIASGSGAGGLYRIVGSKFDEVPVLYLEEDPNVVFDTSTSAIILPSLLGLTRSSPLSHSSGAKINVLDNAPVVEIGKVESYSGDEDLTIQDVIDEICTRTGGPGPSKVNLFPSILGVGVSCPSVKRKNFILRFTHTDSANTRIYFRSNVANATRPYLQFDGQTMTYVNSAIQKVDEFPLNATGSLAMYRMIEVSLQDNKIMVYGNGRPMFATQLDPLDVVLTDDNVWLHNFSTDTEVSLWMPEASFIVPSYILDVSKSGLQAVAEVIGNRKIWFREGDDGAIDVFVGRAAVGSALLPYTKAISIVMTDNDVVGTRVLIEGVEVAEKANMELVRRRGNIFMVRNIPEVYSASDALEYAAMILDDEVLKENQRIFRGVLDPRLEAGDTIFVLGKTGTEEVICDQLSISIGINDNEAMVDMTVSGRASV